MPMDVSYPVTLLDDILQDAEPTVVIAAPQLVTKIPGRGSRKAKRIL